jgi:hypothetical protein
MGAGEIVAVLVVAFSATGIPVFAHLGGQAFGVASCFVIAALIANYAVAAVPTTLIVSFLFQNLFVSLVSPLVGSVEEFDAARAYNFFLTATIWLVLMAHYVSHWTSFEPSIRRWINFGFVALALVFAYFCLGVPANPKGAAVYLRNVATPFLLFQICVLVGARVGLATARPLIVVGYLALIYGYSELFFRESLLSVTNSDTYFELRTRESSDTGQWVKLMQETGRVVRDFEDTQRIKLLNTPLLDVDLEFDRLMGPNLHSISFAYALCFFSLLFLARGRVLFLLAALPLLVIIGSKGALIMLVVTAAFVGISRFVAPGPLFWAMIALLCSYAVATIVVGSRIGDYHVIGLMGGLEGFAANPLGRGLGAGGNLSLNMAAMNWNLSQALGKTDTAVESAIGVLLYQMGVAGLALCAGTVWIARRAWRQFLATRRLDAAVVAFALLAITANGLFQEEALFAPLALGTLMALAGLVLSQERAALRRRRPVRADPPLVFEKAS